MIPGFPITIACPYCEYLALKQTFMSRNTFGVKHWSDGKITAPMYPELPELVLCKKCDKFFWVCKAIWIGSFARNPEPLVKQATIDYIEFPTFHEYFKALGTISDEYFIRKRIWYSFNDYFRKGKEDQITPEYG